MTVARIGSCLSAPFKGEEGSLAGRVSRNWRTVPAAAVTAILVVALIASLIYGPPGLSVTYGVGTGLSTYLLYLAYQYRNLQSLERSATAFEEALKSLDEILGGFDQSRGKLDTSLASLATQVTSLGTENREQLDLVTQLATKLTEVLTAVNVPEQHRALGRLEGQQQALEKRNEELRSIANDFRAQLGTLITATGEVEKLEGITEQLAAFETNLTAAVAAALATPDPFAAKGEPSE